MRSSSACPTTSARCPSARISRSVRISPTDSKLPASTTVSASLRRTVWPFWAAVPHYVSEPPNPAVVILGWIRRLAPIFRSDWPLDGVENR